MKLFKLLRTIELAGVTLAVLVISALPSYAYIDPGTGSFVLQAILAGLLALGFVIKTSWKNLVAKVARIFGRDTNASDG